MGAIGGLVLIGEFIKVGQDSKRDKRVVEAMRAKGLSEDVANAVMGALAYVSLSPKERPQYWKEVCRKYPEHDAQKLQAVLEYQHNRCIVEVMRDPEIRHAWIDNTKREAEIAKVLEGSPSVGETPPRALTKEEFETLRSEARKRTEEALRAHGITDEPSVKNILRALDYGVLSPEDREKLWEEQHLTPEQRAQRESYIKSLWTYAMSLPDIRHAWINDVQVEAEVAKMVPPAASSG